MVKEKTNYLDKSVVVFTLSILAIVIVLASGNPTAFATYTLETGFVTLHIEEVSELSALFLGGLTIFLIFLVLYKKYPALKKLYKKLIN